MILQFIDTAILAGIFFRMGGYEATFKWIRSAIGGLNKRVTKLEEQINELA